MQLKDRLRASNENHDGCPGQLSPSPTHRGARLVCGRCGALFTRAQA